MITATIVAFYLLNGVCFLCGIWWGRRAAWRGAVDAAACALEDAAMREVMRDDALARHLFKSADDLRALTDPTRDRARARAA